MNQKQLFQDGKILNTASTMQFQTNVANDTRTLNQDINDGLTESDGRFCYRQNTISTANHRNSALYSASFIQEKQDIYEDMALGDDFLNEYFSQV